MKKRILIFGISLDRRLDIFEYGESVNYKKLCKDVKWWKDVDKDDVDESDGNWFVRGCKDLMRYYWYLDWFRDEIEEFRFNIIKYKDIDVNWNDKDEDSFIENFFNDYDIDYNEYVMNVKDFLDEVEEEDSWRKILNNNYVMED